MQAATITYGLRTSALALGVTTVGWLVAPPLQVAGLPLLVYMGIPAAQAAYEQLWLDGRPNQSLAETVILVVGLARGDYWISALGFCCYYGVRHWRNKPPQDAAEAVASEMPRMAHGQKEGVVYTVPSATLQPGDRVILQSGEVAPVDGLIVEGVARLRQQGAFVPAAGLRKAVGDRVMAADLVLVGRICVRMIPAA
jgi:cation transport ATPase